MDKRVYESNKMLIVLRKCRYRNAQESQPQMAPGETLLRA